MKKRTAYRIAAPMAGVFAILCSDPAHACDTTQRRLGQIVGYYQTDDVMILAHRGYWSGYNSNVTKRWIPENSYPAIQSANDVCMDGVEVDVKTSRDNVSYVIHDFNLGRTTNYAHLSGNRLYDPYRDGTNPVYNPRVLDTPSTTIDRLRLLSPDRRTVTDEKVPRVDGLMFYHLVYNLTVPLIFDVKTSTAVRDVSRILNLYSGSNFKTAMKVNATLYTTREAFNRDAPNRFGIPVFTTNMLGIINVDNALDAWFAGGAAEVNVKQSWGLMYTVKDKVVDAGKRAGVFHALPDENHNNGTFFRPTGECCYKLSDLYYNWKPGFKDTEDRRGNLDFLFRERYNLITTDDPNTVAKFYSHKGKRRYHPGSF